MGSASSNMCSIQKILVLLLTFCVKHLCWSTDTRGPMIIGNLEDQVDFSNDTGVTIDCRTQGNPVPSVSWVRADNTLVSNIPGLRQIYPNGSLHFLPFNAKDYRQDIHASVYKCMAVNPFGTVISNDVRVRAAVKQFYEIQVYDQYVIQGNTAILTCHIPPFIQEFVRFTSWEREKHKMPETIVENGRYSIYPDGVLHIRDVRRDGSGFRYRCRTQHRLTGEYKRSASSGKLIVTEASGSVSPQITHSRQLVEAWQGEKVRLPCVAQGFPVPQYRWEKIQDGLSLRMNPDDKIQMVDGTLVLRNVQIEDIGSYVCIANNSVGTEKADTLLTVISPLSAYIQPDTQEVDVGKPATFSCTTSGHPVTFVSWIRDGRFLAMDDRVKLLSREILRIESVKREDRGMYQCIARNDRFSVQASAELKLGDAAPVFLYTFREQTIHSGNPLSLKCIASGNPPLVAKWTLDDVEILSADFVNARNDIISYINITKAMTEDGGEYRCIMSNRVGTIKHSAQINVYGPPVVRVMQNVSAVAGRDAIMKCKAAGYPIDSILWEKGGLTLPTNHRQKVFPNGTLIIQKVNRMSDAGYYSCVATNRQGQAAQRPVHLSVLNAPVINPFFFPTNLRVGVRAGIQCLITEGDLPISITWLKDGRPIPPDTGITTKTLDEQTRSLIINSVTSWHNGSYTCVASNAADSVSHTAKLFVNVPPHWLVEPTNSSVILHRAQHLDCQADGSPMPTITWKKAIGRTPRDYTVVSQITLDIQEAQNGSLLIREAEESHEGYYLCQASNGVGQELSKVIYLDVQVPAYFEENARNQSTVKGKDAILSCIAKGDDPITVKWKQMDNVISPVLPRFIIKERPTSQGLTSQLIISRVERQDTNVYYCESTNPFGQDTFQINLIVKEPPEAPKTPMIISKTSRAAHISWKAPFKGNTEIQKYILQYRTESETWEQAHNLTVAGETSAVLTGFHPASKYPLRIFAENEIGTSPASTSITITTDEEAPEGPPLGVEVTAVDSRSLKVTWKPPKKELWNGEILGYHIGYREYDVIASYDFKTHILKQTSGEILEYFLNDLKRYAKYGIVLEAYNALGVGPRTKEVIATTMEDVPSKPPHALKCTTLSSHSIRVDWEPPPRYSHHGILQGFKIFYRVADKVKEMANKQIAVEPRIVLENLMKFTNYSVEVMAYNGAGDGKLSDTIFCQTDEDVPGPPGEIKALVISSDAVLLSWRRPRYPNGIITKYTVYISVNDQENLKPISHTVPPTQLYYEARGLDEELTYGFWTTASTSVGEGNKTQIVAQSPTSIVPARIASFPERITMNKKENIKLECRTVGIPTPDREWRTRGEKVEAKTRLQLPTDGSLIISNTRPQDSGNYTCRVRNIYANDEITYELIVQGPLVEDALPPSPVLEKKSLSKGSLVLAWSIEDDHRNPIQGYSLNYRENTGKWKEVNLDADNESYTFENLKCATHYQFYIMATNNFGISEPSDILDITTEGGPPQKPSQDVFIQANDTYIRLNFSTWLDGGCPNVDFIIEYKARNDTEWRRMVYDTASSQQHLLGLQPNFFYTIRIQASNEAGYTTAEYEVSTMLRRAGQDFADYSTEATTPHLLSYVDLNIIIPVATVAGIILLSIAIICTFLQCRRYLHQKAGGSTRQAMKVLGGNQSSGQTDVQSPLPASPKAEASKMSTNNTSSYQDSVAVVHDDICPYATYQLPACSENDPASMQLKTFSHVKTSEDNWPQSKVLQTIKLRHSKKEPTSIIQETAVVQRRTQGSSSTPSKPAFDDSSGQLSWLPDSMERKEILQIHPFPQTSLIPSAPPAEGSSSMSDSEDADVSAPSALSKNSDRFKYSHTSKNLHRVPDLLHHRPDSSTSNEESPDSDQHTLTQRDFPKFSSSAHSRLAALRQGSSDTTPEDVTYTITGPLNAPPGFADKPETSLTDTTRTGSTGKNKGCRNLDAEEEELIALLKRGQVPGDNMSGSVRDERRGHFSITKQKV